MTIKRVWHGYTTTENADAYQTLLICEVLPRIKAKNIPGLTNIEVMRYKHEETNTNGKIGETGEVEYVVTITYETLAHVVTFAGMDYEKAYLPEKARTLLARYDDRCMHYEVVDVVT
ncbi:hypothetical protein SARC_08397 [Sphaeroforma arctica JP610]|uniref:Antibiotic biosynthesis monooxygenase n=1 Tax=Sphaeroforma arctica JP610 TaxID=667725 RepID=A0A0L0FTA1_9EUKA|nr:hypothetical protein SARC_08397 [Sphaeroforma arctica JP610]KNC79198.1 hypothetical protein SARC_08397 [Sphaeroforma arctica JP610]|eukprot:XP_014153100.1 hypothetical protein SARC_08397 [Sphaeroforma arctica JP610]